MREPPNKDERREVTQEVAKKLGWDVGRVKDVKSAIPDATSLNRPLTSEEDSSELGDLIEDDRESAIPSQVVRELETRHLMESVERAPERQRRVRRYGLTVRSRRRSPNSARNSASRASA